MLADRAISGSVHFKCLRHFGMVPPPPDVGMEYTQLTPAPVQGECRDLMLPGLMVRDCTIKTTIGASGSGEIDSHIFVFLSNLRGEVRLNGRTIGEGLTAMSGLHPFEAVMPPTDMLGMTISRDLLNEYLETVEEIAPPAWVYDGIRSFGNVEALSRTARMIRNLLAHLDDNPAALMGEEGRKSAIWAILDILVPGIIDVCSDTTTDYHMPNRYKVVRRTREYILDRINEPLQISAVCRDLGVSRRALQYSFQDALNINPVAFMRILRLNGARRDLVKTSAALQVKDVIDRWGFWHPSRFSGEYKQMFDELPSETLRRCRASA